MTEDHPNRRRPLAALAHSVDADWHDPDADADFDTAADARGHASDAHVDDTDDSTQQAPNPPLKLLVMDRRGGFSSDIERAARSLTPAPQLVTVRHPTHLLEQVQVESPDVVLAAPEEMTATGLRRLAQVHRASPKTVIALTQGSTPISMTDAATCGASEVISYPASSIKLRNALHRILDAAEALRTERIVIREIPTPAQAPSVPAVSGARATVFTVTSPTGGCGKTFFATNLAAYLAHAAGGRVLLVDLDLQFGEVSLALGLRPQRTISELINEDNMAEAFPEYLMDHSSGYKVLSAPADPFAAELVGPREATQVLECARGLFDYVVVDTPPSLNEVVLAAFDQSRYLVVMATLDVPSLRNLRVFLETIERLKLPVEDVSCVLNKAEPDNGIDLAELLKVYPRGFAAVLPYSKEVSRSLNVGQPVLMVDPRSEISQKLLEAGTKLVPAAEVSNPGWGGRPAAKVSWAARRRERHSQMPPVQALPVAPNQPAYYPQPPQLQPAPAYRESPQAIGVGNPPMPAARREESAATPQTAPSWAFAERAPATPAAEVPAGTPNGTANGGSAHLPAGRRSWLKRLFGRTGRHSIPPSGQATLTLQPLSQSVADQLDVGPRTGPQLETAVSEENRFGGSPDNASTTLVFSGSHQASSTAEALGRGGRRHPIEGSSASRKESRS